MKKSILFILAIFSIFSCTQEDADLSLEKGDADWLRLEIPAGREAYAIAGDLDKTLLVTTWTKAYYTTDKGKTWQESKNFNGHVPGLFTRNDTVFSLESSITDNQGGRYANMGQYFTADYGVTWHYYSQFYNGIALDYKLPLGYVQSATGTAYRIKQNTTPTSPGSTSYYFNPSELMKEDASGQSPIRFPFQHHLINLHLDASNRLYVAASGGNFLNEKNILYCCDKDTPAVIYVSKKQLP